MYRCLKKQIYLAFLLFYFKFRLLISLYLKNVEKNQKKLKKLLTLK